MCQKRVIKRERCCIDNGFCTVYKILDNMLRGQYKSAETAISFSERSHFYVVWFYRDIIVVKNAHKIIAYNSAAVGFINYQDSIILIRYLKYIFVKQIAIH